MSGVGAEREREGKSESEAGSRLWVVGAQPDTGFKPTNHEIMTWAKVSRLTDWATQAPLSSNIRTIEKTHRYWEYYSIHDFWRQFTVWTALLSIFNHLIYLENYLKCIKWKVQKYFCGATWKVLILKANSQQNQIAYKSRNVQSNEWIYLTDENCNVDLYLLLWKESDSMISEAKACGLCAQ